MKGLYLFPFVCVLLAGCNGKLPDECISFFQDTDTLYLKMEINRYVPAYIATNYKLKNEEFLGNYKKWLKSAPAEQQITTCKMHSSLINETIEQLEKVKSEEEVKKIFSQLK